MTKQVFQTTFAGRELIVETGQVAKANKWLCCRALW